MTDSLTPRRAQEKTNPRRRLQSGPKQPRGAETSGAEVDEGALLIALAALLSLLAFAFFYRSGDILLYGDAVAHLNIARRLIDGRELGWNQVGTVWLPLPHLLAAPFVAIDALWRNGVGGSIPSLAAYVLGVAGVFRLVRARLQRARVSSAGAWLAAAIYGLNPSLLYLQSTAMTESIFLAALLWSVVYLDAFLRGLGEGASPEGISPGVRHSGVSHSGVSQNDAVVALPAWRALERCGLCLAAAIFTRYDGWIVAFVVGIVAALASLRWALRHPPRLYSQPQLRRLLRSLASFLLLLALCPVLWLAHNYKINLRPLDWLNGPYSASAIERRTTNPADPPYPGKDHPMVAAEYFLKAARMNTGEGGRDMGGREQWLILLAAAGSLAALWQWRRYGAWLVLWLPLPFYAFSIAYGSVPIFVPEWWPFSYYNVRYGLELLPAIAVFVGLLPSAASSMAELAREKRLLPKLVLPKIVIPNNLRELTSPAIGTLLAVTLFGVTILAYASSAWCFGPRSQLAVQHGDWPRRWMIPICYREAWVNSRGRVALETQVATALSEIPDNTTLLMYTGDYVGALQKAGIPLKRVISECDPNEWGAALSAPFASADYVVAVAGDPVAEAVRINPRGLTKVAILHTMGKPEVAIYRSTRP